MITDTIRARLRTKIMTCINNAPPELMERITNRINDYTEHGCITLSGAANGSSNARRPLIVIDGRNVYVARLMIAWRDGLDVYDTSWIARHRCDNPQCVNPDHLLSGTKQQNASDRGVSIHEQGVA